MQFLVFPIPLVLIYLHINTENVLYLLTSNHRVQREISMRGVSLGFPIRHVFHRYANVVLVFVQKGVRHRIYFSKEANKISKNWRYLQYCAEVTRTFYENRRYMLLTFSPVFDETESHFFIS